MLFLLESGMKPAAAGSREPHPTSAVDKVNSIVVQVEYIPQ